MSTIRDLEEVARELHAIVQRAHGESPITESHRLPFDDRARYKAQLIEGKVLLDEGLGRLNDYSTRLVVLLSQAGSSLGVGTSDVAEAREMVLGGLRRLRREANGRPSASIPAADRYVTLTDNQKSSLQDDLAKLSESVRSANEIDDEERQIALSEIAIFEQTIAQPRVSTELIQRFVDGVLTWIAAMIPNVIVSEIIKRIALGLVGLH